MSSNLLRVRRAVTADAELIADLSRKAFHHTFAAQNTPDDMDVFMNEQFTREKLIREVGAAGHLFFLAELGDRIAGYAFLKDGNPIPELGIPEQIEIARFYAMPEFIGQGVGAFLMKHCINLAREMGKKVIWLGVWEHNARAIAFYQKFGYEKFGEHEFILGSDHQHDWMMKLEL